MNRKRMNEYDVTFTSLENDELALDLHRSSGTSHYVKFRSVSDLLAFFSSLGFDGDRLAEFEGVCSKLKQGQAYHETVVFPDSLIDEFQEAAIDRAGMAMAAER